MDNLAKKFRSAGVDVEVSTGDEGTSCYVLTESSAENLARMACAEPRPMKEDTGKLLEEFCGTVLDAPTWDRLCDKVTAALDARDEELVAAARKVIAAFKSQVHPYCSGGLARQTAMDALAALVEVGK